MSGFWLGLVIGIVVGAVLMVGLAAFFWHTGEDIDINDRR